MQKSAYHEGAFAFVYISFYQCLPYPGGFDEKLINQLETVKEDVGCSNITSSELLRFYKEMLSTVRNEVV